jgi:hypothetical protein
MIEERWGLRSELDGDCRAASQGHSAVCLVNISIQIGTLHIEIYQMDYQSETLGNRH